MLASLVLVQILNLGRRKAQPAIRDRTCRPLLYKVLHFVMHLICEKSRPENVITNGVSMLRHLSSSCLRNSKRRMVCHTVRALLPYALPSESS